MWCHHGSLIFVWMAVWDMKTKIGNVNAKLKRMNGLGGGGMPVYT